MLIRGVVGDKVEDDLDAERMSIGEKKLEIVEGTKARVDSTIFTHIVTEIDLRRREDWGEPNGIDAKVMQIGQLAANALKCPYRLSIRTK